MYPTFQEVELISPHFIPTLLSRGGAALSGLLPNNRVGNEEQSNFTLEKAGKQYLGHRLISPLMLYA